MSTPTHPRFIAPTLRKLIEASLPVEQTAFAEFGARLPEIGIEVLGAERGELLRLGLVEWLTNIRRHGITEPLDADRVVVSLVETEAGIEILVLDPGPEFDPTQARVADKPPTAADLLKPMDDTRPSLGLGLALMRDIFDCFEYRRREDGNEVRLVLAHASLRQG